MENKLIWPPRGYIIIFRSKLSLTPQQVTYRKLEIIHFGLRKSSRQKLAAKVAETELN